jgi:hypothetical protein
LIERLCPDLARPAIAFPFFFAVGRVSRSLNEPAKEDIDRNHSSARKLGAGHGCFTSLQT